MADYFFYHVTDFERFIVKQLGIYEAHLNNINQELTAIRDTIQELQGIQQRINELAEQMREQIDKLKFSSSL